MRIMFLYMFPLWGNGSGAWLRALVQELVKKGHAVAIVAPETRKLPGVKHYVVKPPQMGVFVGNPELPHAKKYEEMTGVELSQIYSAYINTTIPAVKEFQPEIVHAFHTVFLPPIARLIKVLYGIKFIVTTHGSDLHYLNRDKRFVGLIKDSLNVSPVVTANSAFTRRWFLKMFGSVYKDKLRTIPGGVYLHEYKSTPQDLEKIDKKYNLAGKKVVLFTGRLTVHKGVQYLVKAARQIKGEVIILGDGPERQNLEKLIKDYKLTNTRILGYMSSRDQINFKHFYARADVYVAPSTWNEPLGLVILEAMAAKTPVVVTRTGGALFLVKDGQTGYLVHARNAQEITDRVNFLLDHDQLREKIGERAQKIVAERFTWERLAERFVNIYKKYSYTSREYLRLVKVNYPNKVQKK